MATVTNRKLISFGRGLAMTIPKSWADYYRLKPGDKVMVVTNKRLIVKPIGNEVPAQVRK